MKFKDIRTKSFFKFGGNNWRKQSTRTARVVNSKRSFYFKQHEQVTAITDPTFYG